MKKSIVLVLVVLFAGIDVYAQAVADRSLSYNTRRQFRIHGVTDSFINDMAELGYEDLYPDELVSFRIHGVSPAFVRDLKKAGYENLSADALVSFRIHGVSPTYMAEMRNLGFDRLDADDLVSFRIHGVRADDVRAMRKLGFEMDADQAVSFRIHGVSESFLNDMADMGIAFDADDAVSFRIHGVSREFVREVRSWNLAGEVRGDDYVAFRIHGVDTRFVEKMNDELGFERPAPEELIWLRIYDINGWFRDEMKELGLGGFTPNRLVAMKILKVDQDLVDELTGPGGRDMTVRDVLDFQYRDRRDRWDNRYDRDLREALESVVDEIKRMN